MLMHVQLDPTLYHFTIAERTLKSIALLPFIAVMKSMSNVRKGKLVHRSYPITEKRSPCHTKSVQKDGIHYFLNNRLPQVVLNCIHSYCCATLRGMGSVLNVRDRGTVCLAR